MTTATSQREGTVPGARATERQQVNVPRVRGVVQRMMPDRGYAFIRCLEGKAGQAGTDYFCHRASLEGWDFSDMREGTLVEFQPTDAAKGPRAERVVRATEN